MKNGNLERSFVMSKVYLLLAEGFEEVEALATADVLVRSGIEVILTGVYGKDTVKGSHGFMIGTDRQFESPDNYDCAKFGDADAVILPGGKAGTANLMASGAVAGMIRAYNAAGKYVCAICAAPTVLGANGILDGHEATCFPGCESGLGGAVYTDVPAIVSGNIITGRSMGCSVDFGLKIAEELVGKGIADKTGISLHRP